MRVHSALLIAAATMVANTSFADPLPKGAVKMTSAEVRAIYAGKSSNWSKSRAYFSPDGKYFMYGKDKTWFAEGKWTVSGNKICANSQIFPVDEAGESKSWVDCWTWNKAGNKLWDLWSGEKDKKNGWWDKEMSKFSKGDKVTRTIAELKKRAGS